MTLFDFEVKFNCGKLLPDAMYFHVDYCEQVDSELVAQIERIAKENGLKKEKDFNVLKINRDLEKISFLLYEDFNSSHFPKLLESIQYTCKGELTTRTYGKSGNHPILHRKELLLPEDSPGREKYESLTRELDDLGLFQNSNSIGYERQWQERLDKAGIVIKDHTVIRLEDNLSAPENADVSQSSDLDRHKTAIKRYKLSAPMTLLNKYGYLNRDYTLFDFGCGQGDDLAILDKMNVKSAGWDPHYRPQSQKEPADIVNLGFVLNVIESRTERKKTLKEAFSLAQKFLCVSVMLEHQYSGGERYKDGYLTSRNTFQKYFTQAEFREYLTDTLDVSPVSIGRGIFLVFKDEAEEQTYLEKRYRSTYRQLTHAPRLERLSREEKDRIFYEENQDILDPFQESWYELGRPPLMEEFSESAKLIELFGSWKRALNFTENFVDLDEVKKCSERRYDDLRVYFAMLTFEQRKTYAQLPIYLQQDVKVFFGGYTKALEEGKNLLMSAGDAALVTNACIAAEEQSLGYLNEENQLQFEGNILDLLAPVLRVVVNCASILYGDAKEADLIKIHGTTGKVSFMSFDDFEGKPLPEMTERIKVNLRNTKVKIFSYGDEFPSPLLYRKSNFLHPSNSIYKKQFRFDAALEEFDILGDDEFGPSKEAFYTIIAEKGLKIKGYSITEDDGIPEPDSPCGQHLTFRELIECGTTYAEYKPENYPLSPETYKALRELCVKVLDPAIDYFGDIVLTYGFASPALTKLIKGNIAPKLDQHSSCELNRKGDLICDRAGAAVDFYVEYEDMLEVAQWIAENTEFDRLYFYGSDRPIHVSVGPQNSKQIVHMKKTSGKQVPLVTPMEKFLDLQVTN